MVNSGDKIIEKAQHEKLPVIFHEDTWVSRGGLASYGPSFADLGRRAAGHVDRIVRGAKTAELPVEQPTRFESVINLRAARSMDITIPDVVRLQADRLIE